MKKIMMHGIEWDLIDCTTNKDKKLIENRIIKGFDRTRLDNEAFMIIFKCGILSLALKKGFEQFKDEEMFLDFRDSCIKFQRELYTLYGAGVLDKMLELNLLDEPAYDGVINLINLDFEIFYFAKGDFNNLISVLNDYINPILNQKSSRSKKLNKEIK